MSLESSYEECCRERKELMEVLCTVLPYLAEPEAALVREALSGTTKKGEKE